MKNYFMKQRRLVFFLFVTFFSLAILISNSNTGTAKNINNYIGSWVTTINSPQDTSTSILNISKKQSEGLSATIDQPATINQRNFGSLDFPIDKIEIIDNRIVFEIISLKARFEVQLKNQGKSLEGHFKVGKKSIPIIFTRIDVESQHYRKPRVDRSGKKQLEYEYRIPKKLEDGWEILSLKKLDIDRSKIETMMEDILNEKYENIHSVIIVKKGKLIVEEYFYAFDYNMKHVIASDTKSFTSALIGIALDKGHITDLNQKLSSYFTEYSELFKDEYKSKINLKHLLTMTGGFDWDESSYSYLDQRNTHVLMNNSGNQVKYVLERSMKDQPGKRFVYNSGLSLILGEIIRRTTYYRADRFAEKYLFGPLDISDYSWSSYPNGTLQTGGGIALRPRDMAKFGYLFLSGGVWKGKRIISEKWIIESTEEHVNMSVMEYGYQWWRSGFFNIITHSCPKTDFR